MRKSRLEIKEREVLEEILSSNVICRLAMVDEGQPYLLPFNYGYHEGCIYIHSAPQGRKIGILRKDPRVCFEVEDGVEVAEAEKACGWSTRYRSVVGYGSVEILDSTEDKQHGLEVIMAGHGAPHLVEYEEKELKRMVILKLSIASMTGKHSSNWERK